jgi:hypothetical protein
MVKKRDVMDETIKDQHDHLEDVEVDIEAKVKDIGQEDILRFRYVGNMIMHFYHNDTLYQLIPNTVYFNLPDCEPVKRMINAKELIPI